MFVDTGSVYEFPDETGALPPGRPTACSSYAHDARCSIGAEAALLFVYVPSALADQRMLVSVQPDKG